MRHPRGSDFSFSNLKIHVYGYKLDTLCATRAIPNLVFGALKSVIKVVDFGKHEFCDRNENTHEFCSRLLLLLLHLLLLLFLLIAKRYAFDDFYRIFNALLSNALYFAIEFSIHWFS